MTAWLPEGEVAIAVWATVPAPWCRASPSTAMREDTAVPGLMHVRLGGYRVADIEFSAAFDVAQGKVGRDLAEAITAAPNNTIRFADVPSWASRSGAGRRWTASAAICARRSPKHPSVRTTSRGPCAGRGTTFSSPTCPWARRGDLLVCRAGAQGRLRLRELHSRLHRLARSGGGGSRMPRLPVIGDDIKSQVGATIVHRAGRPVPRAWRAAGPDLPAQLRRQHRFPQHAGARTAGIEKAVEDAAVTSQLEHELPPGDVHVGPSDHVPWLTDRKFAHIRLEGTGFGNVPLSCELKLEVWFAQFRGCRDRRRALRQAGARPWDRWRPAGPSAYFMKSPPAAWRRRGPAPDRSLHPRRSLSRSRP